MTRSGVREHMPVVFYVAGYGRSGSTLLDMLVDSSIEDVFGAGELKNFFEELRDGGVCSCGEALRDCSVWRPVVESVEDLAVPFAEADLMTQKNEGPLGTGQDIYFTVWRRVIAVLHQTVGFKAMVDSSKISRVSIKRIFRLRQLGCDVAVLHLVRDPRGIVGSLRKGTNRGLARGQDDGGSWRVLRGCAGWFLAQVGTEYVVRRNRLDRRLVHYEEMVASPQYRRELLDWIRIRAGLERSSEESALRAGHGVSGNRMRRSARDGIVLQERTPTDSDSRFDRFMASLLRMVGRNLGYYS